MKELFAEIERVLPDGGQWCTVEKACTLASIVVGLRPRMVVEIGVWMGGSMIPMLMAMKYVGQGEAVAIDPWSPAASIREETITANIKWWGEVDHENAYRTFLRRMTQHKVAELCTVKRESSDTSEPPAMIDMIHIDGNHGPQAYRDVQRFAPHVTIGGILVLDDVGWDGGHVTRARELAGSMGFHELYPLESGVVMQRMGVV